MRRSFCMTLIAFALCVGCGGAAFAAPLQDSPAVDQSPTTMKVHGATPQQETRRLAHRLNLTPAQETAIGPILQKRADAIARLRGDASIDASSRRSQLHTIRRDSEQELRATLSDSQLKQYDQLRQQARQRHLDRKSAPATGGSRP